MRKINIKSIVLSSLQLRSVIKNHTLFYFTLLRLVAYIYYAHAYI
jgi:hypothetical protein